MRRAHREFRINFETNVEILWQPFIHSVYCISSSNVINQWQRINANKQTNANKQQMLCASCFFYSFVSRRQSIEFIVNSFQMELYTNSGTTTRFISSRRCEKLPKKPLLFVRCDLHGSHESGAWNEIHQLQYHQVVVFMYYFFFIRARS